MADSFVRLPDDSANLGKRIDNEELTVGLFDVLRQRIRSAGAAAAELLDIRNAAPGASDYGAVTRVGDGHDVNAGATTDGAVTTDAAGSLSAKVRGLVSLLASLVQTQGATQTDVKGPMVQAVVSDSPNSYLDGVIQPLSLTSEGRLRVSSQPSEARADVWGDLAVTWFDSSQTERSAW